MGIKPNEMSKIKTFDDLEFFPHQVVKGGKHAFMKFPSGEWVSVVGGPGLYGNGETTFEVLTSQNEEEPALYQSKEEVSKIMADIQTPVI